MEKIVRLVTTWWRVCQRSGNLTASLYLLQLLIGVFPLVRYILLSTSTVCYWKLCLPLFFKYKNEDRLIHALKMIGLHTVAFEAAALVHDSEKNFDVKSVSDLKFNGPVCLPMELYIARFFWNYQIKGQTKLFLMMMKNCSPWRTLFYCTLNGTGWGRYLEVLPQTRRCWSVYGKCK